MDKNKNQSKVLQGYLEDKKGGVALPHYHINSQHVCLESSFTCIQLHRKTNDEWRCLQDRQV